MSSENVLINITEKPIKTKHLGWTSQKREDSIELIEIVENHYHYPNKEAPGTISKLEMLRHSSIPLNSEDSIPLRVFYEAETNLTREVRRKLEEKLQKY